MALLLSAVLWLPSCNNESGKATAHEKSAAIELRLNFLPGVQYAYIIDSKTEMEQTVMGQSIKTNTGMLMEMTYAATGREGEDTRMNVTYNRIALHLKNPMMQMDYDTDSAGNNHNPMLANMGALTGKTFSVLISNKGAMRRVDGLDSLMNTLNSDTANAQAAAMAAQIRRQLSDTAIQSLLAQSFAFYPPAPVHPGDVWTTTSTSSSGGVRLQMNNEYRLDSVSAGIATITVTTKITSAGSASAELKGATFNLSGMQNGTLQIAVETGMLAHGNLRQNISGTVDAMGMNIPMTATSVIQMEGRRR